MFRSIEGDDQFQFFEYLKGTNLNVVISFLTGERTAVPQQVDEADGDTSIDIQDKLKHERSIKR